MTNKNTQELIEPIAPTVVAALNGPFSGTALEFVIASALRKPSLPEKRRARGGYCQLSFVKGRGGSPAGSAARRWRRPSFEDLEGDAIRNVGSR